MNASPGKVLVFGATGATAQATAIRLHQRGFELHLAGRDESVLAPFAERIGASFTVGDVRDPDHLSQAVEQAGDTLAGLMYAAGTIHLAPLGRVSPGQIREDFEINALAAAMAVQAALPALKNHSGTASVVLFSSIAASRGFAFHTSIAMAKAAVEGLTVSLAAELAPAIRVNAIAPSLTRTPLASRLLSNPKQAEAIAGQHPLKRIGEADDLAGMATFLLTGESDWMTGQILHVDGGRSTLPSTS